jgi:hypothetical protein
MLVQAPTTDRRAVVQAVLEAAEQLVATVRGAPDPDVRVRATPEWTLAQAFGHLVTVVPRYSQGARLEGEWVPSADRLADLNDRELRARPSLDVQSMAAGFEESVTAVVELVQSFGDDQPVFRFHGGARVGADTALGILLGETRGARPRHCGGP